jgi:Icc-related predicted phosphoesterase
MTQDSNTLNTIKRLAWLTDIHLDFLEAENIRTFCREVTEHCPDALLFGRDIGTATSISSFLLTLENELSCPIYFVLGNHDYYHGSIKEVRQEVQANCKQSESLNWLPLSGVVGLTEQTCLIGHGGWADGRLGDYRNSAVMLNDYLFIKELTGLTPNKRLAVLKKLADEAAAYLRIQLQSALAHYQKVIVLTHVPPFREACWYLGEVADDHWLPHFSCQVVGEVLEEFMLKQTDRTMTVLCGHTHSSGVVEILPNLVVKTGAAAYGQPQLQEVLLVE